MTVVTITPDLAAGRSYDIFQKFVETFRAPDAFTRASANGIAYSNATAGNLEIFMGGQNFTSDPANEILTGGTVNALDFREFSPTFKILFDWQGFNGELDGVTLFNAVEKVIANINNTEWQDVFGEFDYLMNGSAGNVIFRGFGGDDTMLGGGGNDTFDDRFAGDTDIFNGGGGNDIAKAGSGVSTLVGGKGFDRLSFENIVQGVAFNMKNGAFSSAPGASGNAFNFEYVLGSVNRDRIAGNDLANIIDGALGNDAIAGGLGNDILRGGPNNDALNGGAGQDRLNGGLGRDTMAGGADADIFEYISHVQSPAGAAFRDKIMDFAVGQDDIDLGSIDANSVTAGNQDFAFIGQGLFTGVAGQLRFAAFRGDTLISADRDGNSIADFQILLEGTKPLTGGDFIL